MKIRKAKLTDIPQILGVLKASLGESKLERSDLIWHFKHTHNPFGKSIVLVGVQDDKIIGVRAFMQWRWQLKSRVWKSYRAVDTATDPQYQGQGVFKKLTLKAVKEVQEQNEAFIFNTPNDKSRPGYLKMGWNSIDKIKLSVAFSFYYQLKYVFSKKIKTPKVHEYQMLEGLCEQHNAKLVSQNRLFTPKSVAYLQWRYQDNPLQDYTIVCKAEYYIAMYVRKHRFFNELRLVELIGVTDKNKREIQKIISSFASENKCWIITLADKNLFRFRVFGKFGPILTFNPLTNDTGFIAKSMSITNWQYSLGDLELF